MYLLFFLIGFVHESLTALTAGGLYERMLPEHFELVRCSQYFRPRETLPHEPLSLSAGSCTGPVICVS